MSNFRSARRELPLDMNKLRLIFADRRDDFDLGDLVLPGLVDSGEAKLHRLLSLLLTKRFLEAGHRLCAALTDESEVLLLQSLVEGFQRLPDSVMLATVARPEVASWIFLVREALQDGSAVSLEGMVHHLVGFLIGPLAAHDCLEIGWTGWMTPSRNDMIDIGLSSVELSIGRKVSGPVGVTRTGVGLALADCAGPVIEISLPFTLPIQQNREGTHWVQKPRLPNNGPVILRRNAWYEQFFPRDRLSRASPIYFGITDDEFSNFCVSISSGAKLVHQYWPEAWREIASRIRTVAPLRTSGLQPHNASVHAFRGLITTSARPGYLSAQTLVHETGHNTFSSICDVFTLFQGQTEPTAYSPFVKTQRPVSAVAHGIFSFLQDIHMSIRLQGKVSQIGTLSIERYIDTSRKSVKIALDNLKGACSFTDRGEQLIHGFERALGTT